MTHNAKITLTALVLTAGLVACGGGGGGGSSPGVVVPAGGGSSTNSPASPTLTPSPTGGSGSASASGRVLDYDSQAPIAGATVVIGNTIIAGATPPATLPAGDISAVTAANGTYTIAGLSPGTRTYSCGNTTSGADGYCSGATPQPNVAFVHVFTSDHITLHGYTTIVAGANAVRDLKVTMPTVLDSQRLIKLNWYRQNAPDPNNVWNPAPVAIAPVVLDEYLTEAERFYAPYAATNNPAVGGQDPDQGQSGQNFSSNSRYHSRGGFPELDDFEDLGGGGGSSSDILLPGTIYANTINNLPEDGFYEEGPTGGHFRRIMDTQAVWIGFGTGLTQAQLTQPSQQGLYDAADSLVYLPQ